MYAYDPFGLDRALRILRKPDEIPVWHQETCPECGRTLVNIYKKNGSWKCKRCHDTIANTERIE